MSGGGQPGGVPAVAVQTDDPPSMSKAESDMYIEAGKDLTPPKMLERMNAHHKLIVTTVATVGTLLAGLGGVAATLTLSRTTTMVAGIPVVPVGTLLVSVLAGSAVVLSLVARRPVFGVVRTRDAIDVRRHVLGELQRGRRTLGVASWLILAAAGLAVVISAGAGLGAVLSEDGPGGDPRNLAGLTATVGKAGAVSVTLSGAVDRLDDGQWVEVTVTSTGGGGPVLADLTIHPDATGKAALAAVVQPPTGSTGVTADITVQGPGDDTSFSLSATYPVVPSPSPT